MSRSLKKGIYCDPKLVKKVEEAKKTGKKTQTYKRASTIIPEFVGQTVGVHNGKTFVDVFMTEDMVGHKLGEFSPTTKFKGHGGKKAK